MSCIGHLSRLFSYLLVLAGIFMATWGALGMLEYLTGIAPVMPLQNEVFPSGLQFVHFLAIFAAGAVFLVGYITKWRWTPHAMVVCYTSLATLCSIETLDFLTNDDRYILFARELFWYVTISIYLFRSKRMRERFKPGGFVSTKAAVTERMTPSEEQS